MLLLVFCYILCFVAQCEDLQTQNVQELIDRVLKRGEINVTFTPILELLELTAGKENDAFEICGRDNDVVFRGTNTVALTAAFGHYLRHYLKVDFHWENGGGYSFQNFPIAAMPIPTSCARVKFLSKFRYYQVTIIRHVFIAVFLATG